MTPSSTGTATYCPEDNKLRLYVDRVPREEYDFLREQGWTATPKQGCDFVAVWTPQRRDTALAYAEDGIIEDEDMGPEDRAADRAERFTGYLDKRMDDADLHASRYEARPTAHGYQSEAKAERAAQRHDRIGTRAADAWGKAEYWQRRTAGVISHALHVSSPAVRMGRIKEIEADIRRIETAYNQSHARDTQQHTCLLSVVEHAEGRREKMATVEGWRYCIRDIREADGLADASTFSPEQIRRCMVYAALSSEGSTSKFGELRDKVKRGEVEAVAAAREWLDANGWDTPPPPDYSKSEWHQHLTLRLAYENQMLEAQGGRAATVEMIVGGWLRGGRRLGDQERRIVKVNKSSVTGRVVSVDVRDNHKSTHNHWGNPFPDGVAKYLVHNVEVERMAPDAYRPPTEQELADYLAEVKAAKAATPKRETIPLINPTDADAERLQAIWNAHAMTGRIAAYKRLGYTSKGKPWEVTDCKPSTVLRMTQAEYSAASKGSYATFTTRLVFPGGHEQENHYSALEKGRKAHGKELCQVRRTSWQAPSDNSASRVIILTDKPQKPLPAAIWPAQDAALAFTVDLAA